METNNFSRFEIRFLKYEKAILNLKNRINLYKTNVSVVYDEVIKEALIQCHEIAIELLWKTLKDYLLEKDKSLNINYSKETIKFALKTNLVENNDLAYILMEAIDNRNKFSYEYCTEDELEQYLKNIINEYYPAMYCIYKNLKGE